MMIDGDAVPTMQLRFVVRAHGKNGAYARNILQQMWWVTDLNAGLPAPHQRKEWRDVPVQPEPKE